MFRRARYDLSPCGTRTASTSGAIMNLKPPTSVKKSRSRWASEPRPPVLGVGEVLGCVTFEDSPSATDGDGLRTLHIEAAGDEFAVRRV